jgi:HSP20 family protein
MSQLVPWRSRGGHVTRPAEHPLERLRREFDDLFPRAWGGTLLPAGREGTESRWDFDVKETDKEIVVRAEMPGFEPREIDVRLENDVLVIQAEKEEKKDDEERYLSFSRAVTLPPGIEAEQVGASYRNGVLELHIPRPAGSRARRITVQGEEGRPPAAKPEVKAAAAPASPAAPAKK